MRIPTRLFLLLRESIALMETYTVCVDRLGGRGPALGVTSRYLPKPMSALQPSMALCTSQPL